MAHNKKSKIAIIVQGTEFYSKHGIACLPSHQRWRQEDSEHETSLAYEARPYLNKVNNFFNPKSKPSKNPEFTKCFANGRHLTVLGQAG